MRHFQKRKKINTLYRFQKGPLIFHVVMVTKFRNPIMGKFINGQLVLSETGLIVKKVWEQIPERFQDIELGAFCVMPEHIHGLVKLKPQDLTNTICLHNAMHWFKTRSSVERSMYLKQIGEYKGSKLWTRSYYETRVKPGRHYSAVSRYIINNPARAALKGQC